MWAPTCGLKRQRYVVDVQCVANVLQETGRWYVQCVANVLLKTEVGGMCKDGVS